MRKLAGGYRHGDDALRLELVGVEIEPAQFGAGGKFENGSDRDVACHISHSGVGSPFVELAIDIAVGTIDSPHLPVVDAERFEDWACVHVLCGRSRTDHNTLALALLDRLH